MSLFQELKRRNVFRVGIAYVLMGWVVLQIADFALDLVGAPNWIIQTVSVLLLIGLPVALFFAWAFELTPEGVKREHEVDRSQSITPRTGRTLDRLIIVVLVLAVGVLLAERFLSNRQPEAAGVATVASQAEPGGSSSLASVAARSVAVLPFVAMSSGPDDEYFSDGLTEEILNSLAQLPELLVTSRTSAFLFKGQEVSVEEVADKLGVAHVVEGSVRRSGDRLRVTAQLIRAEDGFHLWSDTYDSDSGDAIAVQEDIAEKVAEALDVVLDENRREQMQQSGLRDVEAFIAFQKGRSIFSQAHNIDSSDLMLRALKQANQYFRFALEKSPGFATAWILHADYYTHLLVDSATGVPLHDEFAGDVASAAEQMLSDLGKAAQNLNSEDERLAVQWDMAYLSGNWRGSARRLDLMVSQAGCAVPQWGDMLSLPFGYAGVYATRLRESAECNPLLSRPWSNLAVAHNWDKDPQAALEALSRVPETNRGDHYASVEVFTRLIAGQPQKARDIAEAILINPNSHMYARTMIAAAEGDLEQGREALAKYRENSQRMRVLEISMMAMLGDREGANVAAAEIDTHPHGYIALPIAVAFCGCGAPWDIDITPRFKQRLEESGLQWPPRSPVDFPLKDW
jgi:TolB-like protein